MIWIGTVALTVCMFVSPQRNAADVTTTNPHAFFNKAENCTCCHDTRESETAIDPHSFSVDIIESCTSCHTDDMIGRSHPVGVRADERFPEMEIPENLPLDENDLVTCGTCHNPHLEAYLPERYAHSQAPVGIRVENGVEVAYYKSYMLRVHVPAAGYDPTCAACHARYF